jgi:DNA-binding transcriptional regulator YdaS (Cro superfamily)
MANDTNFTDVQTFFKSQDFLNISAFAKKAGINPSLLRQYASGTKQPSAQQVERIKTAILTIAEELEKVRLGP